MNITQRVGVLLLAVLASHASATAATLEQASPGVLWVKGDRPGAAISSVIVTNEGLIVVDATCRSEGTAAWLKGELKKRFKQPVKYVVLSHDHEDHICDLDVFDDTATTVSHVKTREAVVREKRNTSVPDITFDEQLSLWLGGR